MCKCVRRVKKTDIVDSIIPLHYLSKFTGLAPVSLAYTHDKQGRVRVNLKTSVPAVLYTVLLITGIAAALCFVLTFVRYYTIPFGTEQTKHILIVETVANGIACITNLAIGLTRIRKEMNSLLYKVSVIDILLGTKTIF